MIGRPKRIVPPVVSLSYSSYSRVRLEDVEAGRDTAPEEIGLGEGELKSREFLPPPAENLMNWPRPRKLRSVIEPSIDGPARIAARRIAGADRELAGRLVDHVDHQDDLVGLGARRGRNLDSLKEIKRFQPTLRALDQHLVEGVALADVEFAADDIVARAVVAADLDALDIGLGALVDRIDDRDRAVLEIAVAARRDLREGIAQAGDMLGQRDDRVFDVLGVVDVARMRFDQPLSDSRGDVRRCVLSTLMSPKV